MPKLDTYGFKQELSFLVRVEHTYSTEAQVIPKIKDTSNCKENVSNRPALLLITIRVPAFYQQ